MAIVLLLSSAAATQDQVVKQTPNVIRVTTSHVVVDVNVTDKNGRPVSGLKPEDFRVVEDGAAQTVTNFREVRVGGPAGPAAADAPRLIPETQVDVEVVPEKLKEKRVFILLFNLASMGDDDLLEATQSARNFANSSMTPDDALAIYSFGNGLRLLTNFTNSRDVILSAIGKVDQLGKKQAATVPGEEPATDSSDESVGEYVADETEFAMFDTNRQLSAIESLVQLYKEVPQKKAIIFFSSGLTNSGEETHQQLRWTIDLANKNNTSVYTVDTRGLVAITPGGRASEAGSRGTGLYSGTAMAGQMTGFANSQEALVTLAKDTGGKALLDSNDLAPVYRQVQKDAEHYYLVGYNSSNNAHDGRFRRIKVEVARPGVTLRYRQGYTADKSFQSYSQAEKERHLQQAVLEDEQRVDFTLEVATAQFLHRGLFIYAPVFVKFSYKELDLRGSSGKKRYEIDLVGFLKAPSGLVLQSFRDRILIEPQSDPARPTSLMYQNGFTLPTGKYEIVLVARENTSGNVSRAQLPLEVRNLKEPELATSSIIFASQLQPMTGATAGFKLTSQSQKDADKATVIASPLQVGNQELVPHLSRRFTRAQPLLLSFDIYHALPLGETPEVDVTATILDATGKKIQQAPPIRLERYNDAEARQIRCNFKVPLSRLSAGQYTLSIDVRDGVSGNSVIRREAFSVQ
ncbi:MAG: VWA domain-containing protein [Acidobacteriota bacterium]